MTEILDVPQAVDTIDRPAPGESWLQFLSRTDDLNPFDRTGGDVNASLARRSLDSSC